MPRFVGYLREKARKKSPASTNQGKSLMYLHNYGSNSGRMSIGKRATVPIFAGPRKLPEPDEWEFAGPWDKSRLPNIYEGSDKPTTAATFSSVMKDVWNSQTLLNQFYGDMVNYYSRTPEQIAWQDAVAWIEQRKFPKPDPVDAEWPWPSRDYVRDHEEDFDWDDD